jgi:hypothetical protein
VRAALEVDIGLRQLQLAAAFALAPHENRLATFDCAFPEPRIKISHDKDFRHRE